MAEKLVTWEAVERLSSLGYPWKSCLINKNGKHNKFWEIEGRTQSENVVIRYGRIGTVGTTLTKNFAYAKKKLHEKLRKKGDNQYQYDPKTDLDFPMTPMALEELLPTTPARKKQKMTLKPTLKPKPEPIRVLSNKEKLRISMERRQRESEW